MSGDILEFSPLLRRLAAGQFGHEGPSPTDDPVRVAALGVARGLDDLVRVTAGSFENIGNVCSELAKLCDGAKVSHEDIARTLREIEQQTRIAAAVLRDQV